MLGCVTGILLVLLIALWIRWRKKLFTVFKDLGIPGPEPGIFFGNVREMVKKGPVKCQDEWVKKYGGVLGYYYGTWPTLLVTDPELLKQVLIKDFSSFADRPDNVYAADIVKPDTPWGQNMTFVKGKKWKETRGLITPAFTTGKLKQMIPLLNDSVSLMVANLEKASANGTKDVEMFSLYRAMTMDAISRTALGADTSVQDIPNHPLLRLAKLVLSVDFSSFFNVFFVSFREFDIILNPIRQLMYMIYNMGSDPLREIFAKLGAVVQARKETPSARRADLLQTLIDARADKDDISDSALAATAEISDAETDHANGKPGLRSRNQIKLSDVEVQANAFVFFFAGYETTSNAMAFLTHHLVNYPQVQDKIREEILEIFGKNGALDYDKLMKLQYTDRVISESLRVNPPVFSFILRQASREVLLGKYKIPAGMTVQVLPYSLHYMPEFFENPTTFDPDRFLPENRGKNHSVTWTPFGAGPRNCVGMRFALLEMKMALVTMLRKFRLETGGKTEIGHLTLHYNFAVGSPKNGVHVRAVPL